jgi:hypothetical protein
MRSKEDGVMGNRLSGMCSRGKRLGHLGDKRSVTNLMSHSMASSIF